MPAPTTDEFLQRFFAQPNLAWPNADPESPVAARLTPFLPALTTRGECPAILPRRGSDPAAPTVVYVVCWDIAHAGRVRALLEASVAHHWCHFDGRVARLDPDDQIDRAVLDLVGPGTTFVLRPTAHTANATFRALSRLASNTSDAPLRQAKLPRPIGRMLREFDLALAAGAVESSASLLHDIESYGGISFENVAFLQLRRLARLGKDEELLAHGSLPTLIYAEPPRLVREAVLASWARTNLTHPLRPEDIDSAVRAIQAARPDVAMLVDESMAPSADPYVRTMCTLVAIARRDGHLAEAIAANPELDAALAARLSEFRAGIASVPSEPVRDRLTEIPEPPLVEPGDAGSWLDWASRLGGPDARPLEAGQAQDWAPPWRVDSDLAEAIDALPEVATDDLLAGVAGFLDVDDTQRPAAKTASALIRRYLVEERFTPYDLSAVTALLAVFLRSSPPGPDYREVLGDLRAFAPQWVAVGTATNAIDLADVVVCGPVGDTAARSDFVTTVMSPLNQQKRRLPATLRRLAELVTSDVALDFDWTIPEPPSGEPSERPRSSHRILLYSLDTGTLARVEKAISLQWPDLRVSTSSDRDGNPTLKQHARNADLVVMATRWATHAATGFIAGNAEHALIRYPDGSGSASMLRAVESGIELLS